MLVIAVPAFGSVLGFKLMVQAKLSMPNLVDPTAIITDLLSLLFALDAGAIAHFNIRNRIGIVADLSIATIFIPITLVHYIAPRFILRLRLSTQHYYVFIAFALSKARSTPAE